MERTISLAFVAVALLLGAARAEELPPQLVALDSPEGMKLLDEATAKQDFVTLVRQFVTQKNPAFCGVASSVMVMNGLPIDAPESTDMAPYHAFTQDNVFDLPALEKARRGGLTLDGLVNLMGTRGVDAQGTHAADSSLEAFREQAKRNLATGGDFVLVNFMRSAIGQEPPLGGHWSPLGAYDDKSDRFLVLDVARVRYPPFWVKAADLFAAMNTTDPDAGKSRGWVTVRAAADAKPKPAVTIASRFLRVVGGILGGVFLVGVLIGSLITWLVMRRRKAIAA